MNTIRRLPRITMKENEANSIFLYEFVRQKNSGLLYKPQKSLDTSHPASWVDLTAQPNVVQFVPIDANWERVIYEEIYNSATTPRCFGRVEVTLP
jgi:hypothetical protein